MRRLNNLLIQKLVIDDGWHECGRIDWAVTTHLCADFFVVSFIQVQNLFSFLDVYENRRLDSMDFLPCSLRPKKPFTVWFELNSNILLWLTFTRNADRVPTCRNRSLEVMRRPRNARETYLIAKIKVEIRQRIVSQIQQLKFRQILQEKMIYSQLIGLFCTNEHIERSHNWRVRMSHWTHPFGKAIIGRVPPRDEQVRQSNVFKSSSIWQLVPSCAAAKQHYIDIRTCEPTKQRIPRTASDCEPNWVIFFANLPEVFSNRKWPDSQRKACPKTSMKRTPTKR